MTEDPISDAKCERIETIQRDIAEKIESLVELAGDESWDVRSGAIEALQELFTWQVRNCLIKGANDDEELVRVESVEIIELWGDKYAIEALKKSLEDESSLVRGAAEQALGALGIVDSYQKMKGMLEDAHEEERVRLLFALTSLGGEEYFDSFLAGLDHEYYRIRCATANLALELTNAENSEKVTKALQEALDKDETVAATEALERALSDVREKFEDE